MLTGETTYRLSFWRKKLILQVYYWGSRWSSGQRPGERKYEKLLRDATLQDHLDILANKISPEKPDDLPGGSPRPRNTGVQARSNLSV